ncbi:TPA: hypothetical protein NNT21_004449 [Salmonella enterica]|nr:hypothetical protein [Salmonella enterica]
MNEVIVTINDDYDQYNTKGCLGVVLAYDRDKRFLVKVIEGKEVGLHVWLKPHWLDGIDEVVGSYRHMALYKFPSNIDTPETKKERFQYYKERTRKPYKGFQNGMCMFSIKVDDVWFDNMTRKKLISKVRHCLQNDCNFIINIYYNEKYSFTSSCLMESSIKDNDYTLYDLGVELDKKCGSLQRKIENIIKEY